MRHLIVIAALALALGAMPAAAQTVAANATTLATGTNVIPATLPLPVTIGVVNLETIASDSVAGQAATARIQALVKAKQAIDAENSAKLKELQDAKPQDAKAIQAQALATDRYRQDAQHDIDAFQNQLQAEFQKKLLPVLSALAQEKGLQMLLSFKDSGIIWGDKSVDLTKDAIAKMDATK